MIKIGQRYRYIHPLISYAKNQFIAEVKEVYGDRAKIKIIQIPTIGSCYTCDEVYNVYDQDLINESGYSLLEGQDKP